ncbi:MAG: TonB-dependent receptor [Vicinamibacterales bacterium]
MKPFAPACLLWMLGILTPGICFGQLPFGSITGVVRDPSGGVIGGAAVQVVNRATGQIRTTTTAEEGEYAVPALAPGQYGISVEAGGFQRSARAAIVETGSTTRADFDLRVGDVSDFVTVPAASPQIHYDAPTVGGVITSDQITGLPLNGRSFLDLAKLEPGVQAPTGANRNRTIVAILGAPATNVGGARFTIDGGDVTSVGLGGSQMGFSQEAVQEFQVATVNFDLSSGMTDAGAINVVTRAGGNQLKASAFYFFRDHNLAAYPALRRDPDNPDPYFQRQQFGLALGGALRRDRVFYFGNWERNDQRAVAATTLLAPDFAPLSRITASPLAGDLFSVRLDGKIDRAHTIFARYSRDGSRAFGPTAAISGGSPNAYPSNWNRVVARADQSLVALTSVLRTNLLNDLRVSAFVIRSSVDSPAAQDCAGCLGLGAPAINIPQAGLVIGNSTAIDNVGSRFHLNDSLTWQRRAHRLRLGANWEHNRERNLVWSNQPVTMTLFSPARVRAYNAQPGVSAAQRISMPTAFSTIDDILQLPLQSVTVGVGDPAITQENGGTVRRWATVWLYAEDAWRLHDRLTMTYGVGWGFDGVLNHDLRKPALLAPILGPDALGPTRHNWTNFAPVVGMAWTPSADGKTVFRAGAGRFYRSHGLTSSLDAERVALGPPGLGRQDLPGSSILNWIPGIPGLPLNAPLEFRTSPTLFTGADLMAILPSIRAGLARNLANADPTVQQIQISKQAPRAIFPLDVPNPSAVHLNLGIQRELALGWVLSADAVYRGFSHVPQGGGSIDLNHFNSVRGAAVPRCTTGAQADDPHAFCSLGPINVQKAPFRFTYTGLVARIEKRLSKEFQVLGSYAYSRNSGTNTGNGFNLDDWLQNRGPAATDYTHILNIAGVLRLPAHVDLGFNFSFVSAPPFSAYVGGVDFNGDGTTGDLLPGTTVNVFNRGMGRADLERLVAQFDQQYAGATDPLNTAIPQVRLPAQYSFGDNFHTLDLRVSRSFLTGPRVRVSLIGEAFNLYNASNLSLYSGDLTSPAFGQPSSRVSQIFGSGGPRSFQLAARASF